MNMAIKQFLSLSETLERIHIQNNSWVPDGVVGPSTTVPFPLPYLFTYTFIYIDFKLHACIPVFL
jgi:hypothetical protein